MWPKTVGEDSRSYHSERTVSGERDGILNVWQLVHYRRVRGDGVQISEARYQSRHNPHVQNPKVQSASRSRSEN